MKLKSITLHFFSIIALLCISTSPIIVYMSTNSNWYHYNYQFQRATKKISPSLVTKQTNNLTRFFLYKEKLNSNWKKYEIQHMRDVRTLLYTFLLISLISLVFLILLPRITKGNSLRTLRNASSLLILLLTLFSIPIFYWFPFFWDQIFHPLFFKNNTWLYYKRDMSSYLFTLYFFIRSSFLLTAFCLSFNLLILTISGLIISLKKKSVSTDTNAA